MDFVRHDAHAVTEAYFAEAAQLLPGPHPAHGVVRIAKQHKFHFFVDDFLFKVSKVYRIFAVRIHKRTVDKFPFVVFDRIQKRVIHGAHNKHAVALVRISFDRHIQRENYAGREHYLFVFKVGVKVRFVPVFKGFVIARHRAGISVNAKGRDVFHLFYDLGNGRKIHIRNPHRKSVRGLVVFFVKIVFPAACSFSVDDFVKVVHDVEFSP